MFFSRKEQVIQTFYGIFFLKCEDLKIFDVKVVSVKCQRRMKNKTNSNQQQTNKQANHNRNHNNAKIFKPIYECSDLDLKKPYKLLFCYLKRTKIWSFFMFVYVALFRFRCGSYHIAQYFVKTSIIPIALMVFSFVRFLFFTF